MFLFEQVPGGRWAVVIAVLAAVVVAHRLLRLRRRREQLRRRRLIRARLHSEVSTNGVAPPPATPATTHLRTTPPIPEVRPIRPIVIPPPAPSREIDLTEPGVEIDLRDRVVYGSEITLESGDTVETGVVGPFPAD